MPDLESLLQRLIEHRVEFVIVGGYAAMAHGVSLVTQDTDICMRFSPENLRRLEKALSDLHPCHRMTPARLPLDLSPAKCKRLKNLYLATDLGQLDCLGAIAGIGGYDDVLSKTEELVLDIGTCRVLTLDALIQAKQAMDRPRDQEAVRQLLAIKEKRTNKAR